MALSRPISVFSLRNSLFWVAAVLLLLFNHRRCCLGWVSSSCSIQQHQRNTFITMQTSMDTEERENIPVWCPEQQIYIGGVVPSQANAEVQRLIQDNEGQLRIFGYGSLCWNPGRGALAYDTVTTTPGRARSYKRCWAQKSADHRGTSRFPGVVCTLLSDEEVCKIRGEESHEDQPTMTEGLIYTVPPLLVEECLSELDFREKGGYARDVIDVVEDDTGKVVKALLYRGTPDNPAFWERALLDLVFAAAIMSVSHGPSGPNDVYLFNLDKFMRETAQASPAAAEALHDHTGDTDTGDLATMARALQQYQLFFLFGSGSNQHNQLLLASAKNSASLVNGEDAHELKEIVAMTPKMDTIEDPIGLFAGGGHSGLLTDGGSLFLWGWNDHFQLGRPNTDNVSIGPSTMPCIPRLENIDVEHAALGFSHTLVIEKGTGRLFAFGDNGRGQVDGSAQCENIEEPTTPVFVKDESFVDIAAGLFHSAAITSSGELVTFGCGRFGQCLSAPDSANQQTIWRGRWKPDDGSKLVQVACGRRHTAVLDEHGRVWTFGENKYGQLGRWTEAGVKFDPAPRLVDGFLGEKASSCYRIESGWSHTLALIRADDGTALVYGWGRNDKGQLGTRSTENMASPIRLFESKRIETIAAGSESTIVVNTDDKIWGCGWNEHGNLSTGNGSDAHELAPVVGARIVAPPPSDGNGRALIASGGAHLLAMKSF
jgi:alpha-tubulin suppressor-like RCC1 family protein/cation transport regulator ChaC